VQTVYYTQHIPRQHNTFLESTTCIEFLNHINLITNSSPNNNRYSFCSIQNQVLVHKNDLYHHPKLVLYTVTKNSLYSVRSCELMTGVLVPARSLNVLLKCVHSLKQTHHHSAYMHLAHLQTNLFTFDVPRFTPLKATQSII
jgi:hypothetical protein